MDWNTITILALFGIFNAFSFWMGTRLARGESIIPPLPGKLDIIEPEEPEEKYNEIWPKDRIYNDTEESV
jgi:hypothetical protein